MCALPCRDGPPRSDAFAMQSLAARGAAFSQPTLGYEALRRSRATVEDFARSYFFLHGMPVDAFLQIMDVLIFVEASLYEVDEFVEAQVEEAADGGVNLDAVERITDADVTLEDRVCGCPAWGALISFLQSRGLLDAEVRRELENGLEYWALERRLGAVLGTESVGADPADLDSACRASSMKSFDYRVLHLILYQLRGVPYDDKVIAFMREAEILVEIEDDLKDYHKDVLRCSFNLYRAFVRAHGRCAPKEMRTHISRIEAHYARLRSEALDEQTCAAHIARNESQESAGPVMAPRTGAWQIPEPILDELLWRAAWKMMGGRPVLFVPAAGALCAGSTTPAAAAATEPSGKRRRRNLESSGADLPPFRPPPLVAPPTADMISRGAEAAAQPAEGMASAS